MRAIFNRIVYWIKTHQRISLLAGFVLLVALGWVVWEENPNDWTRIRKLGIRMPLRYQVHGIDVSHHQGAIDWQKVKKIRFSDQNLRLRFFYLKATEGTTRSDRLFADHWQLLKKMGLRRGAYHFYIPWRDPLSQADNFAHIVNLEKGDLPPVLDFEQDTKEPQAQLIRDLSTWLNLIEGRFHVKPIIYTNNHFYQKYIKGNFDDYPLWIADYDSHKLGGDYPSGKLWFWQHSRSGNIEGIRGSVDVNVFMKDEEDFEKILVQ
jgi:lysozyme